MLRRRRSFQQSMQWDASLPEELVERIWCDPNGLLAEGALLQEKPRCSVVHLDAYGGNYVWKRYNWGGFGRTLRRSLSKPVAKTCWLDGQFLSAAGVPTPQPRLYLQMRAGPVNTCSYLLTDYIEGTSLYRFLRYHQPAESVVRRLAGQVADIWQRLDDLRIQHNDFQTENFLVDPQQKLWLIDLERARRCRSKAEVRRRQHRDIEDLLHPRNWRADPLAAESFRHAISQTPAAAEAMAACGETHPLRRSALPADDRSQLLTVMIPCRNAADTIEACIKSVRDIADEILVADAGSTDGTVSLARKFPGCRVVQRPFTDPATFEAWACRQARHSWVLRVLPHELVNAELARELQYVTAAESGEDAFAIPRSVYFRGRALNFGGSTCEDSIRLFRKDAVRFELQDNQVEALPTCERVGRVRFPVVCESCAHMPSYVHDVVRDARDAAEAAHAQGQRPRLRSVFVSAPWQFVKSFVLQRGWLDGWAGLHTSVLSALGVYLREAMLWDLQRPPAEVRRPEATGESEFFPAPAESSASTDARVLRSAA